MSNSPLVEYTHLSPFCTKNRYMYGKYHKISKITWHHTAGVCSLEQFDAIVHRKGRNMSATYCVDKDARVGLFCDEKDRPWTSSSPENDLVAVTLEISNSKIGEPWPISDKVYKKCIELTVDICKRNGIKKLTYTGDKNGSLTFHRFFAATGCVPIDSTEVLTPDGWKLMKDVKIGDIIATVDPKNLYMTFAPVQNLVPVRKESVTTRHGMTVTDEHRVLYHSSYGIEIGSFKDLEELKFDYAVPSAAISDNDGLDISSSEMIFLLEMKNIGKINDNGDLEFSYIVESKRDRFQGLLINIGYEFTKTQDDLGPVHYTITDERAKNIVNDLLIDGKGFNWKWLNISQTQFSYFIYKITHHVNGNWKRQYTSDNKNDIDIVQAICAINQRGTHYDEETNTLYVSDPYRKMDNNHKTKSITVGADVSCVTVGTGAFIMRQHGYVTVTGNCPGPYIFAKAQEICDLVNAQLEAGNPVEKPKDPEFPDVVNVDIKAGVLVSIANGAVWYNGKIVPSWVINQRWYVSSISGDRAVIGKNEAGNSDIQSPINVKYLTVIQNASAPSDKSNIVNYTKSLSAGTQIYKIENGVILTAGKITVSSVYTIVQETTIDKTKYGKLKSGAGWVVLNSVETPVVDNTIKVGDYVKVLKGETYDGKKFVIYENKYKVLQVKGDRVVISSDGKNITAAVKANNCKKV